MGNPYITIYDNSVSVTWNKRLNHKELQPEEVENFLVDLPVSAWPYGRIIVLTECGPSSGTKDTEHFRKQSRSIIVAAMKRLGVALNLVPSA